MVSDPSGLRAHLNAVVELQFRDGEVLEATLLGLDTERDRDLTYEVKRVVRAAVPAVRGTAVGATVIAPLADLVGWRRLP
jgi:hypothetical protein